MSALISDCGQYRYRLSRWWGNGPNAGFIMLNPSTADATVNDPTIRRCIQFAQREGCGGLTVVNLFAFRATDPAALVTASDPIGPENDAQIRTALEFVDGPLIAAWGSHRFAKDRAMAVLATIKRRVVCLGMTKDGSPRHPLYVRGDQPLFAFSAAGNEGDCRGKGCDDADNPGRKG